MSRSILSRRERRRFLLPLLGAVALAALSAGPASAQAVDPASYFVPDSWADKARRFVEPGPEGLEPGLPFKGLKTGQELEVTFGSEAGSLVVRVVPAALQPADASWTGRRVAIVVKETTLPAAIRDKAVAHLVRVLKVRESGWGWLRRDPKAKEKQAAAQEARGIVREALRLAWLGDKEAALSRVVEAARKAPKDTATLAAAARVVYAAGRPSRARKFAEEAVNQARKAVAVETLADRDRDRVRVVLAGALALANQGDEAMRLAQEVVAGREGACDVVRVARDLEMAGAYKDAVALARSVTDADYRCDEAWALRVDLERWGKNIPAARKLGKEAIERRNESMLVRSAAARAAVAGRDAKAALTNARVPVQHRGGAEGALAVLLHVLHEGGADAVTLERWDGDLARSATQSSRALGTASCWQRNAWSCVTHQLEALRKDHPEDSGLAALHAIGLVRHGQADVAERALAHAWSQDEVFTEALAAEAEVAEAAGRVEDAAKAWTAYIARAPKHPSLLPVAEARKRLQGLTDAAAHAPGRSPTPAPAAAPPMVEPAPAAVEAPTPSGPPWTWIFVALLGIAGVVVVAGARGGARTG